MKQIDFQTYDPDAAICSTLPTIALPAAPFRVELFSDEPFVWTLYVAMAPGGPWHICANGNAMPIYVTDTYLPWRYCCVKIKDCSKPVDILYWKLPKQLMRRH